MLFLLIILQASSEIPLSFIPSNRTPPPQRYYALLVFCEVRNSLIVFGGSNGSENFNDIWEYSLTDAGWSQINPLSNEVPGIN